MNLVQAITQQYQVKHQKSSPYHPQDNGKVESTNKVLEAILTKTVQLHHKDWVDRLPEELWAYRTTWRNTTRFTPYELVYGKQVLLPIEFQVKTFRIAVQLGMNLSYAQQQRVAQLNELDEMHQGCHSIDHPCPIAEKQMA
jgi:transposase InsO family protein